MAVLYELEMQSFPNGVACERYGIGIFRSRMDAEDTARRYLHEVKGFRDYYCEYTIRESEWIGEDSGELVHTWFGWNVDENENEVDILSGRIYTDPDEAEAALAAAKAENERQEWVLNCWEIGKCEWAEGFIRDYPSGRIAPTMRELRSGLTACMEPRSICAVDFFYEDDNRYFFPIAVGELLFYAAEEHDFILNGFTVRRLNDIYEMSSKKGIYQQIYEAEGLTRFDAPAVDISGWRSVFLSLQKLGKHIIVENEYEDGFFRIGRIEAVAEDHMLLRHYDADGIWQEEPARIEYREVTSVTFGSRYVEVFSKYV